MLLQVYPKRHQWHKAIFFDTDENQYYNARTDIYLSEDDILAWSLRPIELIESSPIPQEPDYFTRWNRSDSIKQAILKNIRVINRIYPTVNLYDEPAERLAEGIAELCKSLCPTQIWSSQSDASDQQD